MWRYSRIGGPTFEGLEDVGLDVGRGEDDGGVLDDDLEVGVHEVHDEGDVGLDSAEDVAQRDHVVVVQLLQQLDLPDKENEDELAFAAGDIINVSSSSKDRK